MSDYGKEILLKRALQASVGEPDTAVFIGFFDEFDAKKAENTAIKNKARYMLYGGYDASERKMIGFFPPYEEVSVTDFPISRISATYYGDKKLSHKDFLGALINGGIKRDAIGDIFTGEKSADIFVKSKVSEYIIQNISYVGGSAVKFTLNPQPFTPPDKQYTLINATVSSCRLDAVISAILGVSRKESQQLIESRRVFVNSQECENPIKQVSNDDVFSVRGHGKFSVESLGGQTKKGRLKLTAKKYK